MLSACAAVFGCLLIAHSGGAVPASPPEGTAKAFDWISSGSDCAMYCGCDVNADGLDDLVTLNAGRQLWVALNVNAWKSAGWGMAREGAIEGANLLVGGDWLPDVPGAEVAAIAPGALELYWGYRDGQFKDVMRAPAPEGRTLTGSMRREGGLRGVVTDDGRLWVVRAGALAPFVEPGAEGAAAADRVAGWVIGRLIGDSVGDSMGEALKRIATENAPAYEPGAPVIGDFEMDVNRDGRSDLGLVYECHRPHDHHLVRLLISANSESNDQDSDGLSDDEEAEIGSDPFDRDTDDDGLLDGWEVKGLARGVDLGAFIRTYSKDAQGADRDSQLDPRRQDVIVCVSYFEQVKPEQFRAEMPKVKELYRRLNTPNPDGSRGVWVHFREIGTVPAADQSMPWWDVGNKYFPRAERGMMHWLQVTPWGGGQSSETGDMGGAGNGWAVFAHEFGHQLSLGHTGDSAAAWCPLYPSLMSYAFSYSFDGDGNAVHFSNGEFRDTVLDERHLSERLPYAYERVKYLANHPYRFSLKDGGDGTTLIDWNQNGKFDEGEVEADINYGGSTYCGTRREHELTGSGPCLAYVGDACALVAADQTRDHLWIKMYQGNETWGEKRVVPGSATEREPVLVGGKDFGLLLHHHTFGWHVTRFTGTELGTPAKIPELPTVELNAVRVGDRVLVVSRHDDDSLEYRWLTFKDGDFAKPQVGPAVRLETTSLVPPGLGVDPADGRVVMVTSKTNSRGGVYAMRVTWMKPQGERLWEQETRWTRGEGSGNGCCSRPVVAFNAAGQLTIFHQGGTDGSGQMIAYRTSRVGNEKLDEGWLTCMLYDVWTRSRVPVGFASGPQGAIFGYRWDAGGKNNTLQTAHNGFGIDTEPMRDFDDGAKISRWGIRHSIMTMVPVADPSPGAGAKEGALTAPRPAPVK